MGNIFSEPSNNSNTVVDAKPSNEEVKNNIKKIFNNSYISNNRNRVDTLDVNSASFNTFALPHQYGGGYTRYDELMALEEDLMKLDQSGGSYNDAEIGDDEFEQLRAYIKQQINQKNQYGGSDHEVKDDQQKIIKQLFNFNLQQQTGGNMVEYTMNLDDFDIQEDLPSPVSSTSPMYTIEYNNGVNDNAGNGVDGNAGNAGNDDGNDVADADNAGNGANDSTGNDGTTGNDVVDASNGVVNNAVEGNAFSNTSFSEGDVRVMPFYSSSTIGYKHPYMKNRFN
jgi:hypothetical protein